MFLYNASERLGHKIIGTTLRHYAHAANRVKNDDENSPVKLYEEMRVKEFTV